MSASEFEARVAATQEAWGGLLDEAAAAALVLAQLGEDVVEYQALTSLQPGLEATLRVSVDAVFPPREFQRGEGGGGRVGNIRIRDSTGVGLLVLWDEDVDLIEAGRFQNGAGLRLVDCYVRQSRFGLEVSLGKHGKIQFL